MATATATDRLYEGLFLLTPGAASDLGSAIEHVREILDKAECEIVTLRKWEDRKLAYAIKNQKRGTYLISYFRCSNTALTQIDRDCNLSERITRTMMTKAEHMGEAEMSLELKAADDARAEVKLREAEAADSGEAEAPADETAAPAEAAAPVEEAPAEPAGDDTAEDKPQE